LERNPDKIYWPWFSLNPNPNAILLLEQNQDKIDWKHFCMNENPKAMTLLKQNQNKIHWSYLSMNSNAMTLLEQNKDKIDWYYFSGNPSIYEKKINYAYLKKKIDIIREELIATSMHPKKLLRYIDMGGDIDDF
jgi:glucan-binding YG repeat protein